MPTVLAKLLLPHLLSRISSWNPPIALALGWTISTFVVDVSPPNVTPWVRIFAVSLASITAATGDVLWLGLLRHYGKSGLTGWGLGTGLGGVVRAVFPYVLTVHMRQFLRVGLGYSWYLVPLMLVSHYLILPPPSPAGSLDEESNSKEDIELEVDASVHLLHNAASNPRTPLDRARANWELGKRLVRPFVLPLALSFVGQSAVFPGFSRAMTVMSEFGTYWAFVAVYGLIFQLGNLVARSSFLISKPPKSRTALAALALGCFVLGFHTYSLLMAESGLVFAFVFLTGLAAGATYMGTFSAAVEVKIFESGADRGFGLGFISVGEPAGLILGGLAGAVMESALCSIKLDGSGRWCSTTR